MSERDELKADIARLTRERDEARAAARFQDNLDEYATFHEKHPLANSIEIWGAAMGRKEYECKQARAEALREAADKCLEQKHLYYDIAIGCESVADRKYYEEKAVMCHQLERDIRKLADEEATR